MTAREIRTMRLQNQQLLETAFKTPAELVAWMGAVQAQDYAMAKWAIGARLPGATNESVEQAINKGDIVRTHILRPTWHFISAKDVRWMLALTAPAIKTASSFMNRKLELNEAIFIRSNKVLEKALQGKELTRPELMEILQKKGIPTNDLRAAHLMLRAELDGVVCNGSMRGKQFTYALLDEKVPPGKNLTKEEALVEMAIRYFTSHGPATLQDFAWWSGLSITSAKQGLELAKSKLLTDKAGNQIYWFGLQKRSREIKTLHLLPSYDEFTISYKDRTASLDLLHHKNTISGNGIFKPIIVADGKVIGSWKRSFKKDTMMIETAFFRNKERVKLKDLKPAALLLEKFLSIKSEIVYR